MVNEKVSVVVPIYNVEKYLKKCIDSIINQSYQNIEILLVNDGSTDRSGEIAESYVNKDHRVKFLKKTNGGLSSARNYGLSNATGDYVCFIDSDDFISKDYIQELLELFDEGCDIAICEYAVFDEKRSKYYIPKYNGSDVDINNRESFLQKVFDNKSPFMPVWKNMYRMSMIKNNSLLFDSERMIYTEDQVFNLKAYYYARRINYTKRILYYHLIVKGSLSQGYRANLPEMIINRFGIIESFFCSHSMEALFAQYRKRFIDIIIDTFIMMCRTKMPQSVINVKNMLGNSFFESYLNSKMEVSRRSLWFVLLIIRTRRPYLIASSIKILMHLQRLRVRGNSHGYKECPVSC